MLFSMFLFILVSAGLQKLLFTQPALDANTRRKLSELDAFERRMGRRV